MPYRLLLIEDEEEIRRGIIASTNWADCGFELVGEASDGTDGLEMYDKLQPDVILTDIRMRYMDGLTMIGHLRKQGADVRVIILSGYDDFSYAQQAIKNQVLDYILKPASSATIERVLKSARDTLDAERRAQKNEESIRALLQRQLPLLQQGFLSGLLSKSNAKEDTLRSLASSYMTQLTFPLSLGVFDLDDSEEKERVIQEEYNGEAALLWVAIAGMMRERLKSGFLIEQNNHMVFLVPGDAVSAAHALQDAVYFVFHIKTTVGISSPCECYCDIANRYEEALLALDMRLLNGGGSIYMQDSPLRNGTVRNDRQTVAEGVEGALREGDEAIGRYIVSLTEQILLENMSSAGQSALLMECAGCVIRLGERLGADMSVGVKKSGIENVFHGAHAKNRMDALEKLMRYTRNMMLKGADAPARQLAAQAQAYLDEHYTQPGLTLDEICDALHISQSQFGLLFRRATGYSFLQYLINMRMETACRLLETTALKSYEIAEQIGFTDPNYFSYCFKRHKGVSPVEYRKTRGAQP